MIPSDEESREGTSFIDNGENDGTVTPDERHAEWAARIDALQEDRDIRRAALINRLETRYRQQRLVGGLVLTRYRRPSR